MMNETQAEIHEQQPITIHQLQHIEDDRITTIDQHV